MPSYRLVEPLERFVVEKANLLGPSSFSDFAEFTFFLDKNTFSFDEYKIGKTIGRLSIPECRYFYM